MDSVPLVAITANVAVNYLGRDSFQEVDIAGITMPITKHNFIVKDVTKLADTLRRAFRIAKSGRPGPVLVDITKDVTAPTTTTEYQRVDIPPIERSTDQITEEDLQLAIKMIKKSKKPFVFVGGGAVISDAYDEVKEFVDKVDAPVADTLMGKGAFDGTDPRYTSMVGMHGSKPSNLGITECDLLIAIGARFSDRVTGNTSKFARKAKILQIDVDPAEINKNVQTHQSVIGDIKEVLIRLNKMLEQQDHKEWIDHILDLKKKFPGTYRKDILTGPYIIEKLYELTGGKAVIATEVGQHQMWASQYYSYTAPRTLLTSGGAGTMGYGLGAAIGAKVGRPDATVINIAGDGCFRMNMNEIATATRYNIPIIQIILNNQVLGMVRQWQTLFYGKRYSNTNLKDKVDFVKLAEAMGAKAYRITKIEEVEEVLKEVLALNEPVVVDCNIDCDEKVWPMVAPGAPIEEVFSEEDLKNK